MVNWIGDWIGFDELFRLNILVGLSGDEWICSKCVLGIIYVFASFYFILFYCSCFFALLSSLHILSATVMFTTSCDLLANRFIG